MTTNRLDRELINQLVAHRKQSGLTQTDVVKKLHLNHSAISRLENHVGPHYGPTLATVIRYANAIGATITITDAKGAAE